jgi:hypothetical protein
VLLDPDGEVQELAAYGYVGTPPGLASCAGGVSKQKSVAQVPLPIYDVNLTSGLIHE